MKNKNLFSWLLIIFSAICIYNLGWTVYRLSTDNKLEAMTEDQRNQWMKSNEDTYKTAIENSFSLGLDLKGGMFVQMEIGVDGVLKALAGKNVDKPFENAVANALKRQQKVSANFIDLFVEELAKEKPTKTLAKYFGGVNSGISFSAPDNQVIEYLKTEVAAVIDNSYTILRNRIDQFGVVSPNVQKVEGTGRIILELPGVNDPKRVRNILRSTAKLEFWPTYTVQEAYPFIEKINERMREMKKGGAKSATETPAAPDSTLATDSTAKDTTNNAAAEKAVAAAKDTATKAKTDKDPLAKDTAKMTQDEKDANDKSQNPFFALVQNFNQQKQPNSPEVGFSDVRDTAELNRYINDPQVKAMLPPDLVFMWTAKPMPNPPKAGQYHGLILIKSNKERVAPLDGSHIISASQELDQDNKSNYGISMSMDSEGAKIWKNMTENNVDKSIAIVLDNLVFSYPNVIQAITGGRSSITGNFTFEEAKDLANILRAGKLPAPARIVGEEQVGPTLGADTIRAGLISFVLGFLAVILFVQLYYGKAGTIAIVALIANLFFLVSITAALQASLTLPGIAGIILSMGMAVDANVLIYERVREELQAGKSLKGAVAEGFRNAFSAIIDGNVTTFITGFVLYVFGTGPIRGFAVTLMIGIVTTLVSGLIVTRLLLDYYSRKPDFKMSFGSTRFSDWLQKYDYPFISGRKTSYAVVIVLCLIALGSSVFMGFRLGVDFKGGRQYIVQFDQEVGSDKLDPIRESLRSVFNNDEPVVKTVGSKKELMITTSYKIEDANADVEVESALITGLKKVEPNFTEKSIIASTTVGPTVARDLVAGAFKAVLFSLIAVFFYIFGRFYKWQYGMGALASLVFNVIMVLGVYSLLKNVDILPFSAVVDQTFIASVLTIIGYTLNDTVVVFDRIREIIRDDRQNTDRRELFYRAMKETLSRTLVTAVSVITSAVILFVWGGDVLRSFMFAMIFGIAVGTFSSLFVAAPVSLDLILRYERRRPSEEGDMAAPTPKAVTVP
jgi:SecD/SecF fusion protein